MSQRSVDRPPEKLCLEAFVPTTSMSPATKAYLLLLAIALAAASAQQYVAFDAASATSTYSAGNLAGSSAFAAQQALLDTLAAQSKQTSQLREGLHQLILLQLSQPDLQSLSQQNMQGAAPRLSYCMEVRFTRTAESDPGAVA